MNNIQELRKIIADAPETTVTVANYDYGDAMELLYINCENEFYEHDEQQWVKMSLVDNYFHTHRRLADIRTIIEQAEEIKRLTQQNSSLHLCLSDQMERIAELEKEISNMSHLLDNYDFVNALNGKEHEIRDFEQQAKGIEWVLDCRELNLSDGEFYTIKDKHNNLLEQAAKLKEQEQ